MSTFYSRNFAVVALFSFIAVAVFCVWTATATNLDSAMNDCVPYGSETILCSTNAQNHISAWQNFLNVVPQRTLDPLLLLFLLIVALDTYKTIWQRAPEVAQRFKSKKFSILEIIDPIKRALARGIIQPQIYNPAIV